MTYKEQNDQLLNNFLNRTFFTSWGMTSKEREEKPYYSNYASLELGMNPTCSTKCKYCYLAKFGEDLIPKEAWDKKKILGNLFILLKWLKKNNFNPHLEIFSGDPLVQNVAYDMMEMICDWYGNKAPDGSMLIIPTNMDFLHYNSKINSIFNFIERFAKKNVKLSLSASVDGLYLENNRPHRSPLLKYDETFYNRLFRFSAATGTGFHPMVYSEGIEMWPKNFLWFQEMFDKYKIPWSNLYLLEVRNKEWTIDQCVGLEKFMNFLVNWTWDKCDRDVDKMIDFIFRGKGFNILSNGMSTIGRGIGCSIQSTLMLHLGNLKFFPCHRTSYNFMDSGEFIVEDGEISNIKALNPAFLLAINSMNISGSPMCHSCPISQFCSGGCLGSQYETTGDPFSPIPSVCRMMHYKFRGIFNAYEEIGIMPKILGLIAKEKVEGYKFCLKEGVLK
jgi:radical SAM protein with 4Fe4S-binding SPASM domain